LLIGVRLWGLIARPMTTDFATWQILWTDQICMIGLCGPTPIGYQLLSLRKSS
jgi:hypothetical protein